MKTPEKGISDTFMSDIYECNIKKNKKLYSRSTDTIFPEKFS